MHEGPQGTLSNQNGTAGLPRAHTGEEHGIPMHDCFTRGSVRPATHTLLRQCGSPSALRGTGKCDYSALAKYIILPVYGCLPRLLRLVSLCLEERGGCRTPQCATSTNRETVGPSDWTSGYWTGILWHLSNSSNGSAGWWTHQAIAWTSATASNANVTDTLDPGYIMWGSFGQQYLQTGNETAAALLVQTAHSMAMRFIPSVGAFQSWQPLPAPGGCVQIIVDSLMNLPVRGPCPRRTMSFDLTLWPGRLCEQVVFFAGNYSQNATLTNMAISHAGMSLVCCGNASASSAA